MMEMYTILLAPILAGITAQVIKMIIRGNKQKFSFKNFLAYSGMPSGHTAMVIALAAITGLENNFHSSLFAITVILAIIVIRDALGIRRYLGQHGRTLNILVQDLREDRMLDERYPHLLERIGHTPIQVLVGGIIGFVVSYIIYII